MTGRTDDLRMVEIFKAAAEAAGHAIMRVRGEGCAATTKADSSPVTAADHLAERIILDRLATHFPGIPHIAEEACSDGLSHCETDQGFFLIDPLDGTREFVAGRDEFTVNIALVVEGRPIIGLVHAPTTGESFGGLPGEALRWRAGDVSPERIHVREPSADGLVALVSRSHRTAETDRFLAKSRPAGIVPLGSSLKFCRIAEGGADIYPCLGKTMEWDTAAGEAVLVAAGGSVETLDGTPLAYGKHEAMGRDGFMNPPFIARGANSA